MIWKNSFDGILGRLPSVAAWNGIRSSEIDSSTAVAIAPYALELVFPLLINRGITQLHRRTGQTPQVQRRPVHPRTIASRLIFSGVVINDFFRALFDDFNNSGGSRYFPDTKESARHINVKLGHDGFGLGGELRAGGGPIDQIGG